MEQLIQDLLGSIVHLSPWVGSLFFFISAVLQLTFPPYPGDTILAFGGFLGSKGMVGGSLLIFLSYWIGTVLSSYFLYELGYRKGESLLHSRLIANYFPPPKQELARRWVLRYGIIIFFLCKFVPGLNSLMIIFGGIFQYTKSWAYTGIGLAALLHNILFFLAGRMVGKNYGAIAVFLSTYNKIVILIAVTASILYVGYRFRQTLRKKKPAGPEGN